MSAARFSLNMQCPGVLPWSTIYVVIGGLECKPAVLCNTTLCANTFELVGFLEATASLCFVDASANLHSNESRRLVLVSFLCAVAFGKRLLHGA